MLTRTLSNLHALVEMRDVLIVRIGLVPFWSGTKAGDNYKNFICLIT
jgi:hypothetical protein